jgi:hypothetical protein
MMVRIVAVAGFVALSTTGASTQAGGAMTFDADKPGAAPPGFTFAPWRQPTAGAWTVRRQGANGYLGHEATAGAPGYAIALAPAAALRDLETSVRLRLTGGGRAGGLVWRYQNEMNHYAAVLDLTRRQVALWRVSAGNRVVLEVEGDLELDVEAWHTLKVVHHDDEIRVSIGGIRVFSEADRRGRILAAGRCGVIAKGDAEVGFDDWRVAEERRER